MARYRNILPSSNGLHRMYGNVKYPEIPKSFSDEYIYTTQGDRYDLLANTYYSDTSLWWVISIANYDTSYDSLIPPLGVQIRIPNSSRLAEIISEYEHLNENRNNIR